MVSVPKLTGVVPGPDKYKLEYDWSKKDPEHTQKMVKGPVNSFIKQIEHKNKSPEKSTPAPLAYKNLEAWKTTSHKAAQRIKNTQNFKEQRTDFIEVQYTHANDTPGPKYPLSNPVRFLMMFNLCVDCV